MRPFLVSIVAPSGISPIDRSSTNWLEPGSWMSTRPPVGRITTLSPTSGCGAGVSVGRGVGVGGGVALVSGTTTGGAPAIVNSCGAESAVLPGRVDRRAP